MTLPVKLFNVMTQQSLGVLNYGYLASGIMITMVPCIRAVPGAAALLRPGLDPGGSKRLISF